jgi:hypothetical protein
MIKTKNTHNGRKLSTFVKKETFELYFSRPNKGLARKNETFLNVTSRDLDTGEVNKVRLDANAVEQLRKVLTTS